MKEYLEKETVLKILTHYGTTSGSALGHHIGAVDCAIAEIDRLKPADAIEVRHGYWKERRNLAGRKVWDCSECDTTSLEHGLYCPYCATQMDRETQKITENKE